jgi:hypothetical protein
VKVLIGIGALSVYWTPADPKTGAYEVKFDPPDKPTVDKQLTYSPTLLVGKAQKRVESRPGVVLTYK